MWDTIRPRSVRVCWSGLLWGGGHIPKHSFCAWLAIRNRLGTRDRLSRWDRLIPLYCILCWESCEFCDHLFFSCSFGCETWSRVLQIMSSSHRIGYWGVELSWICHQGIGKGVRKKLWCVLSCATIYFIWNERNHHLHLVSLGFCFYSSVLVSVLVLLFYVRMLMILFNCFLLFFLSLLVPGLWGCYFSVLVLFCFVLFFFLIF